MRRASGALIAGVLSVLACGMPRGVLEKGPEAMMTPDGLFRVDHDAPGVLFVKPDHQIGSYDQFVLTPVFVGYKRGQMRLRPADEAKMRDHLRDAVLAGIERSELAIATRPGPCVLRIRMALVDLELPELGGVSGSKTAFVASFGKVTLIHELLDSQSDEVLLRFAQRRDMGSGVAYGGGHDVDWARFRKTFDLMMSDLRVNLQAVVPFTSGDKFRPECEGLLWRRSAERRRHR